MMRRKLLAAMLPAAVCAFSFSAAAGDDRDDDDRDYGRSWKQVDPAMVAARRQFFGVENVDDRGRVKKDKVIFSWLTNTTYAVSVKGRIILLDSYINRPELAPASGLDRRRTPFNPTDLVKLNPEAIFLGHGHGDHAHHGAYIAKWTGATIYASAETCVAMQDDVQRMWNDPNLHNNGAKIVPNADPVNCVAVTPAGSRPGGYDETRNPPSQWTTLHQFDSVACIRAFKFIHSGTAPVDPSFQHFPLSNLGDPRYAGGTFLTQPTPPATPQTITYPAMFPVTTPFIPPTNPANRVPGQINTNTGGVGGGGAIVIFYHFTLKGDHDFSFGWVNSAGPAKEGIGSDPGLVTLTQYNDPAFPQETKDLAKRIGNSLFDLMDRLPGTDVLFGSIVSLGAANNQQRDIINVIDHLKPKVYYPGHVTDVAQAGSAMYHKINFRETWLAMGLGEMPEFRAQIDPNDYGVPQVFDPKDDRWGKRSSSQSCR
jgi:L-ascorbate metabolism protein UlaG (beta-lactamase superfamily)